MAQNEGEAAGATRVNGKPAVVGIGASAGGVQALQTLFEALPDGIGAAFVVIVHLDPGKQSDLSTILAARTSMPVTQVDAPTNLEANHVYVIPPNRSLQITDREISTIEFDQPRGQRAPIDLFFRSLANQHADGFAVILTGAGSDGTIGVRAVKEAGGIILVQDPNEAEYGSMPRSAIATGVADFILPVREIGSRLAELVRNKDNAPSEHLPDGDEEWLRRILAHVQVRTGHDFSKYKRSTVVRRIARRMQIARKEVLANYYDFLRDNLEEAQALLGDLLISVTTFFRDAESFEALANHVLPQFFHARKSDDPIRVWVPGCATGEEVYAMAILLLEESARHDMPPEIQIFGSDLDLGALTTAREGRYPTAIEADVSEERLRRFFLREGDHYRVKRELRDVVLFASHSLLKDPPFSHVDLISCRNLLIYLDRELQQLVCSIFHYALKPNGFLFLGSSESADGPPGLFKIIDRKARIYQSSPHTGEKHPELPRLLGGLRVPEQMLQPGSGLPPAGGFGGSVHRQALEQMAPPSILVDKAYRVVHLSENAGRYLQHPGGPLTSDVTELVRQELRFDLQAALRRSFDEDQSTLSTPIFVRFNGSPHRVYLQVRPTKKDDDDAQHALILFIEGSAAEPLSETTTAPDDQRATEQIVRQLREELEATQTQLRTTREESEARNEELRASNEELQSVNEEYRSTSEELETSKEELQSINEELQTVNSELKAKLESISRAHSDLQNLMASVDFGTLFLDSGLRIKRFTPRVTELFNITSSDENRPITDFTHQLDYEGLVGDVRTVLEQLTPIEHELRTHNGRWYLMRSRPYRTVDDKIDGVVISFVDITERRKVEEALRRSEAHLLQEKRLVELSREPIFVWDFDRGILDWNRGSEELYGYNREEALGRRKDELLKTSVPESSFEQLRQQLLNEGSWRGEVKHMTKDGRVLTVETRIDLQPMDGRRVALESTRDITERKLWETRQRQLLDELTHRVKNTLTVVQAIAHQTLNRSQSSKDFTERFEARLGALASAHGLLVESNWNGAELGEMARRQLKPYVEADPSRLRLGGPSVLLPTDLATPFGLVLHELGTNAVKHGALSREGGIVSFTWKVDDKGDGPLLTAVWQEQGGPPVTNPEATGFGSMLIEKGIPNAKVRREYRTDGVTCSLELLLPERSHFRL